MGILISLHGFKSENYSVNLPTYLELHDIQYNCTLPELFIAILSTALSDHCNFTISNRLVGVSYMTYGHDRQLLRQWVSQVFIPVEYRNLSRALRYADCIEDIEYRGGSLYAIKATLR